ncbi:ribonuclease H-like domain-containing protein, partial [Tanacetum coccineum]
YSGLEEFQQPELECYRPKPSKSVSEDTSNEVRESPDASLVKELVSDDKLEKKTVSLTVVKIEFVRPKQQQKPVRKPLKYAEMCRSQSPRGNQRNWNNQKSQQLRSDFVMYNKACFICGSFDHVQANCNYHQRERVVSGNNYTRVNYNYSTKKAHPNAHKNMVPRAVLMKTGLRSLNIARPVTTAHPKTKVYSARLMSRFSKSAQSTVKRPYQTRTALTNKNFRQKVNTAKGKFYTAKQKAVNTARPNSPVVNVGHPQKEDQGYVDSGCSRHMTGNMSYLSDFKEFDGGYVTFGGGAKGGKITGKGTLKTGKLDFEDVYFVKELQFNLFSVSQMCDKKNSVLFTDTGCFVLSPDFKLADESQVLLKVPRKNNMYSVDMKNIVPKESLTCLVAKATLDESMLWHRRLGHVNFKTINKLVKENLVRGLPSKRFENDQTCVACLKGKQHKASSKGSTHPENNQYRNLWFLQPKSPTFSDPLDETVHEERGDSVERAATTATSLDAEQGNGNKNRTQSTTIPNDPFPQRIGSGGSSRCQDTILGDRPAQTKFERLSKQSNNLRLSRVNILGSGEDSMTLQELMVYCTTLSKKLESLETDLKQTKQIYDDLEDPSKQGRKIAKIDQDPSISLVQHDVEIQGRYEHDMEFDFDFDAAMEVFTAEKDVSTAKPVSTAGAAVTTSIIVVSTVSPTRNTRVPTADKITMAETMVYIWKSAVKDKGKGKMDESEAVHTKTKLQQEQEIPGFEAAVRLQAELEEEEM